MARPSVINGPQRATDADAPEHPSAVVCTSPRPSSGLFRPRNCAAMEMARGLKGELLPGRIDPRTIFSESEVNRNLITQTRKTSMPTLRRPIELCARSFLPLSLSLSLSFLRNIRNEYNAWDYGRVLLAGDDQIYCTVSLAICCHRVYFIRLHFGEDETHPPSHLFLGDIRQDMKKPECRITRPVCILPASRMIISESLSSNLRERERERESAAISSADREGRRKETTGASNARRICSRSEPNCEI